MEAIEIITSNFKLKFGGKLVRKFKASLKKERFHFDC